MFAWSKLSYKPLRSDERIEHSLSHKSASSIFWPACSAVLLAICLILSVRLQQNSRCDGGSESQFISWKTDFKPAVPAIRYRQVQFGGIVLSEGSFRITGGASTRPYVGTSYDEIDEAWNDILEKRWFNLTAEEKRDAFGDKAEDYLDFVQLDTFHLLHCINHLRKVIDAEFYYPKRLPPLRIHTESVQCHGDLTPIPYRPDENSSYYYSDSIQMHTCRNFDVLRHWLAEQRGSVSIDPFKL
ncbi:hypothetical protein BBK36DRAFT_1130156 [Trichoderma citrinoviride]|uniref:Uncharacterized protein n=1 Tax=Trichoderma citrinoviride TaxID=58853 RepID=A0A2T4AYF5_9HYPO|nr:hypothetical protein BBK36DRAFT_1130156 [Trichoderma citrinoviride]PTB62103.1 hypothetical protein BBK36DRAFT_1130156 [Trichoderma citrinoviride]